MGFSMRQMCCHIRSKCDRDWSFLPCSRVIMTTSIRLAQHAVIDRRPMQPDKWVRVILVTARLMPAIYYDEAVFGIGEKRLSVKAMATASAPTIT